MNHKILAAIAVGGGSAGLLDQLAALANQAGRGNPPAKVLRYVASGILGPDALNGGTASAMAGVLVHFGLTTIMAGLFTIAAIRFARLRQWPFIAGLCYGALLFFAMYYVIVPLSAAPNWKIPQGFWANLGGVLGHAAFVGVPIAVAVHHFLGEGVIERARPLMVKETTVREAARWSV